MMPAESPRQAALLLHAMAPEDRAWMLAALAPGHRARIEALLEELGALGIPPDPALLRPVLARAPQRGAPQPLETLSRVQVERLAGLLAAEPPLLVTRLLRLRDWHWRAGVLARLPQAQRHAVERAGVLPPAPALDATLLQAVQARLGLPAAPSGGAARWWSAWRRRLA